MARTESDSWDLASSVGATATMVATARALASRVPDPLISDPYAADLVRAVGIEFFSNLVDDRIDLSDTEAGATVATMTEAIAVRTRFFDDFFETATAAGIRQAVILASGLDSRAYRLDWPAGTTVFELDQPRVLEFKAQTLADVGATPAASLRTVAIDLRDDWPAALRAAGFDPSAPAAWSVEGLLMYLPPATQDQLFDNITALSAPDSQLATEFHSGDFGASLAERAAAMTDQWGGSGFDIDFTELMYPGDRNHAADYLRDRGWQLRTRNRVDVFADYGREFPTSDTMAPLRNSVAITAIREEQP